MRYERERERVEHNNCSTILVIPLFIGINIGSGVALGLMGLGGSWREPVPQKQGAWKTGP